MTSRIRLVITPTAHRDWRSILLYTWRTWSEDQRDAYDEVIWDALQRIRAFPEIGRPVPGQPGKRELVFAHHVAIYRYDAATMTVTILRIRNPRRRSTPSR